MRHILLLLCIQTLLKKKKKKKKKKNLKLFSIRVKELYKCSDAIRINAAIRINFP